MIKEYFKPKQKPVRKSTRQCYDSFKTTFRILRGTKGVQSNVNPSLRSKGGEKNNDSAKVIKGNILQNDRKF